MSTNTNLSPLLRRAILFLEASDWASADDYCERLLDEEPENAYAYVIKLMARVRVFREEDLKNSAISFKEWNSFKNAYRFADDCLRKRLDMYIEIVENRIKEEELKKQNLEKQRIIEEETAKKDAIYMDAINEQKSSSETVIIHAIKLFESISDYKDSKHRIDQCHNKLAEIQKRRYELELEKRKNKSKTLIITLIVVLAIIIAFTAVVINYTSANKAKANMIADNLIGMKFSSTKSNDSAFENYHGYITAPSIEVVNTFTFCSDNTIELEVFSKISENGNYNEGTLTDTLTWNDVSVSFEGEITVLINNKVSQIYVDEYDRPTAIVFDNDTYTLVN